MRSGYVDRALGLEFQIDRDGGTQDIENRTVSVDHLFQFGEFSRRRAAFQLNRSAHVVEAFTAKKPRKSSAPSSLTETLASGMPSAVA